MAVVAASAFGGADGFRISFAADEAKLEEACAALRRPWHERDLPILFEDGEALVIDKPAGLPLDRPARRRACLEDVSTS